jgi:hypothetical protein
MRKLLVLVTAGLLLGCATSTMETFDAPPSEHEQCVYGCDNEYSSCILECDETRSIGTELDNCIKQCKENWAECKVDCSQVGNLQ